MAAVEQSSRDQRPLRGCVAVQRTNGHVGTWVAVAAAHPGPGVAGVAAAGAAGADGAVNSASGVVEAAGHRSTGAHTRRRRRRPTRRRHLRRRSSPPAGRTNETGLAAAVHAAVAVAAAAFDNSERDKHSSSGHAMSRVLPTLTSPSSALHHCWQCKVVKMHSLVVVQTYSGVRTRKKDERWWVRLIPRDRALVEGLNVYVGGTENVL